MARLKTIVVRTCTCVLATVMLAGPARSMLPSFDAFAAQVAPDERRYCMARTAIAMGVERFYGSAAGLVTVFGDLAYTNKLDQARLAHIERTRGIIEARMFQLELPRSAEGDSMQDVLGTVGGLLGQRAARDVFSLDAALEQLAGRVLADLMSGTLDDRVSVTVRPMSEDERLDLMPASCLQYFD